MDDGNLIFIISQPRSGSTFLQSLLSNNPLVNTTSEPWLMLALSPLFKPQLVKRATYDHAMASDAYSEFCSKINVVPKKLIRDFAFAHYGQLIEENKFFLDKTPRYWEILDELLDIFPKAKIILLKRNPYDVICSMIKTWKIEHLEDLVYLGRDLCIAPGAISSFAEKNSLSPNIRSVTYEALIEKKSEKTSELYDWLEIPYHQKVLDISCNHKILGKYGDPFINGGTKIECEIDPKWKDLISGYLNFLGQDYLQEFNLSADAFFPSKDFARFKELVDSTGNLIK